MNRLFCCTVSLIYEDDSGFARATSPVAGKQEFWWSNHKPDEFSLWESKVELGEKFFNEIIRHPVPIDMNTLKALKRSTVGLDLYLWLIYRTFALRAPQRLTWKQLYQQFGAHPAQASDKFTVHAFRYKVLRKLKTIKASLAGVELLDSSGPPDLASLDAHHPTFGSPSTSRLISQVPIFTARIDPDGPLAFQMGQGVRD